MDTLGFDVEETKGGNTRGSGYWEAPRKTPGETGAEGWASRAELDELRREVAALRREGHKGVSVASTEDWSGERGFLDDDARDLSPNRRCRRAPSAKPAVEMQPPASVDRFPCFHTCLELEKNFPAISDGIFVRWYIYSTGPRPG